MINDSDFHRLADATLALLCDALEDADTDGVLDVELAQGVLTVELPAGKTIVLSKHGPSKQVWMSSPVSGGLHFPYDEATQGWVLANGTAMDALLKQEILQLSGVVL
jgi:frataxin